MRLRELLPLVSLVCALAAVVAGVLLLLERDRAALLEALKQGRLDQLDEAARRFSNDLDDIGEDLRFAAGVLGRDETPQAHEGELRALIEVVGQYKAITVLGPEGEAALTVWDRRVTERMRTPALAEALQSAAREALLREPGEITATPPIALESIGEHRIFATRIVRPAGGKPQVVAVLVDVVPLLTPFQLVSNAPDSRLLVLGAAGRPVQISDPVLARHAREGSLLPAFSESLQRMREHQRGCSVIPENEAEPLGVGRDPALLCALPITVEGGRSWSAATLVSTRSITTPMRQAAVRTLLGAAFMIGFLGLFAGYVVVASRRASALRESQAAAARLALLHERLQRIVDHIPTGVLVLDRTERVSVANPAVRSRAPRAVSGAPLSEVFAPEARGELQRLLEGANHSRQAQSVFGVRLPLWGEEGAFNVHVVPLEAGDPSIQTLLVIEDLSKVTSLESQLVRAEKLATIGVLAAGIAHEIGTPLSVIRGRAEYLLEKVDPTQGLASGLRIIAAQSDQVASTLRQLLDFSRIHAPLTRSISAAAVAEAVRELLSLEAQRRSLTLEVEVPTTLPPVLANEDELRQVLVNLVLNAFDACRPGGTVRISGAAVSEERVELRVTDDGTGIPSELQSQVFDPFFSTKKRGQGTGLGLTVVAQIVRNHGGGVHLESREGAGTTITLSWPAAREEPRNAVF